MREILGSSTGAGSSGPRQRATPTDHPPAIDAALLAATFDDAPIGMAHTRVADGGWVNVNRRLCEMLGYDRDELLRLGFRQVTHPADLAGDQEILDRFAQDRHTPQFRIKRYIRRDGTVIWVNVGIRVLDCLSGDPYFLTAVQDITSEVEARQELIDNEQSFRAVFEANPLPMWVYDTETLKFLAVNDAATLSYGYTRDEFLGMRITDIRPQRELPRLREHLEENGLPKADEWTHLTKMGQEIEVAVRAHRLQFASHAARLVVAEDITARRHAEREQQRLEAELRRQAYQDGLTGLGNRARLMADLRASVGASGPSVPVALLLMDIDRLKDVNDSLGHDFGDRLLVELSHRLQRAFPDAMSVARLSGDEFAVLCPVPPAASLEALGQRAESVAKEGFEVSGVVLRSSWTVGVAAAPLHADTAEGLLQKADVAMHSAKQRLLGSAIYEPEFDPHTAERMALIAELRDGIGNGDVLLHYQPQVTIATGRVGAVEALARWHHPRLGLQTPAHFIPLAEQTDLISPLTEAMVGMALRQARQWHETGREVVVAVNLSARNLRDHDLVPRIGGLLAGLEVSPEALKLELTETAFMENPVLAHRRLSDLHEMGVTIAIDDFGTGYSSLANLKRLPVEELKIDRSFVSNMTASKSDAAIVRSTIDLGHNLGMKVVAEGVEDQRTLDLLAALGCDQAQGFFLGQPMPPLEASHLLAARA